MDTYADDLAALIEALDLKDAALVGHSTGGGEVARYIGRHGSKRVSKAVLIASVPPLMLKTPNNPGGLPISVFDQIRAGVVADRSQFFKDLSIPFYGYNKPGAKISEGVRDSFWLQGMQASIKGVFDCIKAFSETDFTEDLKKIDVPTLILHGDADQIVPLDDTSRMSAKLVKNSTLKVYPIPVKTLRHQRYFDRDHATKEFRRSSAFHRTASCGLTGVSAQGSTQSHALLTGSVETRNPSGGAGVLIGNFREAIRCSARCSRLPLCINYVRRSRSSNCGARHRAWATSRRSSLTLAATAACSSLP